MIADIPEYIKSRIKQSIPLNDVIPYSTPVISFGNPALARVATLGINPSNLEFQCPKTKLELPEHKRRLQTLTSLNIHNLEQANDEIVRSIWETCNNYFNNNPYKSWFCQLEEYVLKKVNASYWRGTACHLDLVQWATSVKWGDRKQLPNKIKRQLLDKNTLFLKEQLQNSPQIELVLLNGKGVVSSFTNYFKDGLQNIKEAEIEIHNPTNKVEETAKIYKGTYLGQKKVIGWNKNIQSTPGVTNRLRAVFGDEVRKLLERW